MDNKNEKTFADLFSSSTKDKEVTTKTFSDILNDNSEEKTESSKEITFDSIFDKISSTNEEEKEISTINNSNSQQQKEKLDDKSLEEEKIDLEYDWNNPFASEKIKDDSTKIDIFEQNDKIEFTSQKELEQKNNNPLFENTVEEPKIDAEENTKQPDNPFFEKSLDEEVEENAETIKDDKLIETPENDFLQWENPFFEAVQSNQIELDQVNNEKTEQASLNTISQSTEQIEQKSNEEVPAIEFNPFINNEEIKEENNIINNPFFEKEESQSVEEKNNTIKENTLPKESTEKKSTSPFFQEETKNEENPFFQNQINLIENQTPNISNGNIDITKSKHYNVKIVKKKEPLIKFILGVISYALFIWLLLIGITLLVYVLDIKIRAAKGDYSSPTFNAYVVLTGSMLPEIAVSDVVITKKVDAEDLKEGDVITFASADSRFLGTVITHRIIKKNPKTSTEGYTFQTKGDNNNVADNALVPEKNIYGKVILKIPKLGYLQEFLASDGGWIIVILIPCLVVISYDIVKLAKGLKRKKYKNIKVQK